MSTRRADFLVATTIGVVVLLLATMVLIGIGGAIEQAYEAGYRDGSAGVPYAMPVFEALR